MDPIPQPQNQNDDLTLNKKPDFLGPNPSTTTTSASASSTIPAAPFSAPASAPASSISPVSTPASTPVSPTPPTPPTSPVSVSANPELDSLMTELNNYQPTAEDLQVSTQRPTESGVAPNSVSPLTPSDPTLSVSPLNATPTDSNINIDPLTDNSSQNSPAMGVTELGVSNEGSNLSPESTENNEASEEDQEEKPLVAAAPTPGSIGSAVSYADFEKKQAEEAAKRAKNEGKPKIKLNRTTILIIIAAVLLVVCGIIIAIMFLGAPQKKPTEASGKNQITKASTKILTCVRPLSTNESSEVGAAYGNFERQFTFDNDNLNSISENYIYQFNSESEAVTAKTTLDSTIKSDDGIKVTTETNLNQLKKISVISDKNVESHLKSLSEFSSITSYDLNSLMLAENQTGLSCSTIE